MEMTYEPELSQEITDWGGTGENVNYFLIAAHGSFCYSVICLGTNSGSIIRRPLVHMGHCGTGIATFAAREVCHRFPGPGVYRRRLCRVFLTRD